MGMKIMSGGGSSCNCNTQTVYVDRVVKQPPNPDPARFKILRSETFGNFTVVKIKYPDCTNFEGDKILLFNECIEVIESWRSIDPHFFADSRLVSRFIPTDIGWQMACASAKAFNKHYKKS